MSINYNEQLQHAFNDWANTYEQEAEEKLKIRGYSYGILTKLIISYLDINKSHEVLELGVGTGIIGKYLKNFLPTITINGIDISKEMIKEAQQKNVYNKLFLDAVDNHLYNQKYSFIYTSFMLHSVKNQEKLISKIYNTLQDNGIFIIIDLIPNINKKDSTLHSQKYEHGAPSNYKHLWEYLYLMEKNNFTIKEVKQLGINKDYNHYIIVLKK